MRIIEIRVILEEDNNELILTKEGILDLGEEIKDNIYGLCDDAIKDVTYDYIDNFQE